MTKTLLIGLAILSAAVVAVIAGIFSMLLWQARKQPPFHGIIAEKYYVCHEHKNLNGGIFGKGPTRVFSGKGQRSWCWREEWKEIDRDTFKRLATEWYGIDWSTETPFWSSGRDGAEEPL